MIDIWTQRTTAHSWRGKRFGISPRRFVPYYYDAANELTEKRQGGDWTYFAYDENGSTLREFDQTADETTYYAYNAFGEELQRAGSAESRFGYQGTAWMRLDSGLLVSPTRLYVPGVGRFGQEDWLRLLTVRYDLGAYEFASFARAALRALYDAEYRYALDSSSWDAVPEGAFTMVEGGAMRRMRDEHGLVDGVSTYVYQGTHGVDFADPSGGQGLCRGVTSVTPGAEGVLESFVAAGGIPPATDPLKKVPGYARCNKLEGRMDKVVNRDYCAANKKGVPQIDCISRHEDVHVKQMKTCCARVKRCIYLREHGNASVAICVKVYENWRQAFWYFTDCAAYRVEHKCVKRLVKKKAWRLIDGATPGDCCKELTEWDEDLLPKVIKHFCPGKKVECYFDMKGHIPPRYMPPETPKR